MRSLRRARDVDEAVLAAARGSDLVVAVEPGELRDAALDALGRVAVVETDGEMLFGPVAELEPEGRRMLELLASGVTIADAAEALHISRRTADRVLARARQSLGARTTAQAVRMLGEVGGRGTRRDAVGGRAGRRSLRTGGWRTHAAVGGRQRGMNAVGGGRHRRQL